MFDPLLNLAPDAYEAIIAAFIVVGLLQTLALTRKARQVTSLKSKVKKIAAAGMKAIFAAMTGALEQIEVAEMNRRAAVARANDLERELMSLSADLDEANDELARKNGAQAHADVESMFFGGGSHFGSVADHLAFTTRQPAQNSPHGLAELFAMLDGKGRNGRALDELIFGRGNAPGRDRFTNAPGRDSVRGPDGQDITDDVDVGDILSALRGDPSGLERALGAKCVGISVVGPDGREITGPEKEALLRGFFSDAGRPAFDPLSAADFGTQVHEEIERSFANDEAARHFGADSGAVGDAGYRPENDPTAHGTVAGMAGPDNEQPHDYAASSPRAG